VLIGGATALLLMLSTGAVAGSPLSAPAPITKPKPANAVLDWTEIAENTIKIQRPPASSEVLMGIVQVAIFDTVAAIEGGYEPYAITPTVNRPVNEAAAVAAAARGVLVARVPAQAASVEEQYQAYLARLPKGMPTRNGIAVGTEVADGIVALRADDGFDNVVLYEQPPPGPGVFEPVAPGEPVDVKLKQVTPLAMTSPDQFRPDGPDPLDSEEYAADFNEVKDLGRADSQIRTQEQTDTALFWSENAFVMWGRTLRQLAVAQGLSVRDTALMMATVHVSAADALIGCFDAKYYYNFWRPIHAIQRADTDGNDATEQDPTWTALLTVNHPEYTSAHACFSMAVTNALAFSFGTDETPFTMDSLVTGTTRTYDRFSDSLAEVMEARIWSGLHFRNSMNEGSELGSDVADLVTSTLFQPTG
jgi:hypothetical protein